MSAADCSGKCAKEPQTIVKSVELRGDEEFQYEVSELDYTLWGDIIAASLEDLQVANASLLDGASVNESDIFADGGRRTANRGRNGIIARKWQQLFRSSKRAGNAAGFNQRKGKSKRKR